MDIKIRKMTLEDVDRVSEIFLTAQGPEGNGEPWTNETSTAYVQKHFGIYSAVAEKDGSIVGFCLADVEPIEDGRDLYIHMLAVDPEIQKQGVGSSLWEFVTNEAKTIGLTGVRLLANEVHYSYEWYEKLGLKKTGYVEMNMSLGIER